MSIFRKNILLSQGQKILIDGEPCSVISHEFHKPGKGQAVVRTKLYNLRTEKVWERTFKSGETIGSADISEKSFQFLYKEGKTFIFMNSNTFDQIEIDFTILGSVSDWLDGEEECKKPIISCDYCFMGEREEDDEISSKCLPELQNN